MSLTLLLVTACQSACSTNDKEVSIDGLLYYAFDTNVFVRKSDDGCPTGHLEIPRTVTIDGYGDGCMDVSVTGFRDRDGTDVMGAFGNCDALTSVSLPDTIEKINRYTFYKCTGLTSIELPQSVQVISEYAFCECIKLKEVRFSASLEEIGVQSFAFCTNLEEIRLPASLKEVGNEAFISSGLTRVEFCGMGNVEFGTSPFPDNLKTVYVQYGYDGELGTMNAEVGDFDCSAFVTPTPSSNSSNAVRDGSFEWNAEGIGLIASLVALAIGIVIICILIVLIIRMGHKTENVTKADELELETNVHSLDSMSSLDFDMTLSQDNPVYETKCDIDSDFEECPAVLLSSDDFGD